MKRYFRIYRELLRLNFSNLMAYRTHLLNSIIGNVAWSSFGIISMLLLTSKTEYVLGWTRNELLILAGSYHIVLSIFYMFFSKNFSVFSDTIYLGKLDAILTKPIDSQFMLSCQQIGYTSFVRFFIGLFFLIYLFWHLQIQITLLSLFGFVTLLILSVVILYSLWFSVMTITIWFGNLSNLTDLLYAFNSLLRNPGDVYRGASIALYIIFFPFMVILTSPVKALLQKVTAGDVVAPLCLAVGLFLFSRMFWKFALRHYTSASA